MKRHFLLVAVGILLLCAVNLWAQSIASNKDSDDGILKVTADKILNDYEENKLSTEQKYKGKIVEITGTASRIASDNENKAYVVIRQEMGSTSLKCYFVKSARKELLALTKGDVVVLRGIWKGISLGDIEFADCEIIKDGKESRETSSEEEQADSDSETVDGVLKVTADEIMDDYTENELAADQKYKEKSVEMTGTVTRIASHYEKGAYVSFRQKRGIATIYCFFAKGTEKELFALKKGETVTIQGTGKGISYSDIEFVGGTIVRDEKESRVAASEEEQTDFGSNADDEILKVSADKVLDDYAENELAADHKYQEKSVEITGTVANIASDYEKNPYVEFRQDMNFISVRCFFTKKAEKELASLKKGESATLRVVGRGIDSLYVVFGDGEIVGENKTKPTK